MYSRILFFFSACYSFLLQISNVNGYETCSSLQSGSARISGLNSSHIGFVQVCKDGYWIDISVDEEEEWTRKNSRVVCKELGFQGATRIFHEFPPEASQPYYSVDCSGLEATLASCSWSRKEGTSRKKGIIVLCRENLSAGEVALVGINGKDSEGIVTLYNPLKTYHWSSICTTEWDDLDAEVVCKQLGFKGGSAVSYSSGQAGPNLLHSNQYSCSGTEWKLDECQHSTPVDCGSGYAGAVCIQASKETLNLTVILLVLMIGIILLLIVVLLFILKFALKRLGTKPNVPHGQGSTDARRRQSGNRILGTEHDAYAQVAVDAPPSYAPPSYGDTLLADQILQHSETSADHTEHEESSLIVADVLSSSV